MLFGKKIWVSGIRTFLFHQLYYCDLQLEIYIYLSLWLFLAWSSQNPWNFLWWELRAIKVSFVMSTSWLWGNTKWWGLLACEANPVIRNLYWWTYLQGKNGDADLENRLADKVREGERRRDWESSIGMCTLSRVKQIAGGKLLYIITCGGQLVLSEDPKGWDGVRGGRLNREEIHIVWQKPIQYCKAIFL